MRNFQETFERRKRLFISAFPICMTVHLLKLPQACNFNKKETLAQMFSCEFCEISKNTFPYRTPPVAASVLKILKISFTL